MIARGFGAIALMGLLALGACTQMGMTEPAAPAKVAKTGLGDVWADAKGMTLYTFDRDQAGKSNCAGPCAQNWPPLMVAGDAKAAGKFSIVTRDDGGKQWAYDGKPLYLWSKDTKAGDTTGEGFNNVWRVARP